MTEPTPNTPAAPTPADTATASKAETKAEAALLSTQKNPSRHKPSQTTASTLPPKKRWDKLLLVSVGAIATGLVGVIAGGWFLGGVLQERWTEKVQQRIDAAQQHTTQATEAQIRTQIQAQTQTLQDQLHTLQTQLADAQTHNQQLQAVQQTLREQVLGLEQALQLHTANGGQAVLLHAVEQLVDMAQQQLTLAGNVSQAMIALETAQARLARASFPALSPLQQAINGDLERLRAVPSHDVAQLAGRLDELDQLLADAPLLADALTANHQDAGSVAVAPTPAAPELNVNPNETPESPLPWWEKAWQASRNGAGQLWRMLGQDLRGLVSIRRIDDPSALLMSAQQSAQLREQLRMRVMMARLALAAPQTGTQAPLWQAQMQQIQTIVQARYDLHTRAGLQALTLAGQLAQTDITVQPLPALNSRQAVQTMIEAMQQAAQQEENPQPPHAVPESDLPEADAADAPTPANPQERT